MRDVVISSRVRLARNLAGMPFVSKCTTEQQNELAARLRDQVIAAELAPKVFYVDVAAASELDKKLLVERHLISRQLADAENRRGVAISDDETMAVMVNEEDHLRMQVLRSGLQLEEAIADINRMDDRLEDHLDFAFHGRYGYLTACPTNAGTGLRVSVMLHLPGLKLTGQIERAFRAAQDMRLAIRGLYGEGTEATGDFFQVSNQTTLGKTESQIAEELCRLIVPRMIDYERRARETLQHGRRASLEDKVFRAIAVLRAARMVGADEAMYLLSLVRLGVVLGCINDVRIETVNELFVLTQPAHLQRILRRTMDGPERAEARARYIRSHLSPN